MSADARYPAWNDKYSMQIIVAIGGGSWREFFKFKEGINANGFHTSLEYMGDIYTVKLERYQLVVYKLFSRETDRVKEKRCTRLRLT